MQEIANRTKEQTDWNAVNWKQAEKSVRNLRERIFRAASRGDHRQVRNLQKLMLKSKANTLMSVRRVTQQNAGKKTPGVDKVVIKTPNARGQLVDELTEFQPWKASPARRIYIPKANGKQRPLGIPTVRDRAMQAMVKNALEPEWEAQFETTSFGFRPGRGCHDAIENIWSLTSKGRKLWVLDADIKGAFDNIDHAHLLTQLEGFPGKALVKQWLKAGFMEGGIFNDTPAGTPQGGVVSPLLANIALHGMENALGVRRNSNGWVKDSKRAIVRYADDFVVLCESEQDARQSQQDLTSWLKTRGLELSPEKTRVVHLDDGFDFLGFNVRRYAVQTKDTTKKRLLSPGYKVLTKPSKEAVKRFKKAVKEIFMTLKGAPVDTLIMRLNALITGWGNYYRHAVSKKTFSTLDHYLFQRQVRWVKFRHHNKGWVWLKNKYFGRFAPKHDDYWVFGNKETGKYAKRLTWIKIQRHTIVKGASSPDDPSLRDYWILRKAKLLNLTGTYATLAKNQNYKCALCGGHLNNDEELHLHHLIQDRKNPDRNVIQYQRLLHYYCHQQTHSAKVNPKLLAAPKLSEPDALKGARPVPRREGRRKASDLSN